MLARVKLALRINHNLLDSEINNTIASARAEMIRSGILADKANNDADELVSLAILTFCKSVFTADNNTAERYNEAWLYQLDCMRKSAEYSEEV